MHLGTVESITAVGICGIILNKIKIYMIRARSAEQI
jgi:hypothetical protein